MKKISMAISAFVMFAAVLDARAEVNLKGAVEFGFYAGLLQTFEDYNGLDPDRTGLAGARLGVFLSDGFSLEGSAQRAFADSAGTSLDLDAVRLSGLIHFGKENHVRPFVILGGGWERFDLAGTGTENDWGAHGGLGLRFISSSRASVRLDAKYVTMKIGGPVNDEWQHNLETTLGVSWLFGADVKEAVKEPVDTDGDGVVDSIDRCPSTPAAVTVDEFGCEVKPEVDSDGDGVVDSADQCPDTRTGVPVDATGCPLDTDGDGVADFKDKCPGTVMGETIDEYGCPERVAKARGALQGVTFKLGSANLTPNSETILDEVAEVLKEFQNVNVEVQGHTDSTGSEALNMRLSKSRAESVKQYIASRGISVERLSANGYGSSNPVADNTTADGRAKNRRVELKWVD